MGNDAILKENGTLREKDCGIKLLTTKEAAEFLRINLRTLQTWIRLGKYPTLKSIKLGRLRKFREQDLADFIESRVQVNPPSGL
jgi:excisionase family DNA binding protein